MLKKGAFVVDTLGLLRAERIPFLLCSYSSLDRFFRIKESGPTFLATDSSLVSLAKAFDGLQFPGLPLEDASIQHDGATFVFRCVDSLSQPVSQPYSVMTLLYDAERDTFIDRGGVYPDLRSQTLVALPGDNPPWLALCEAAKLVSRYHYATEGAVPQWSGRHALPPVSYRKELLSTILRSRHSEKGLALLFEAGFVQEAWPDLATMATVHHAKDYHPEGDVWQHTLETLRYRKRADLVLSLALLLHDSGKPGTEGSGEKRFDGHAELGAIIAGKFLGRLGFDARTIESVSFLVRYHMMPPALKRLPPFRTEKILASPLFPLLLELYRADLLSSYSDEEGYFEACRIYRAFLKKRANPYRTRQPAPKSAANWT